MVVNKDPVTPENLKQQTLDSHVKKSKHGRNLAKKIDNVGKTIVKEEKSEETNENLKTEPVLEKQSNERRIRGICHVYLVNLLVLAILTLSNGTKSVMFNKLSHQFAVPIPIY